MQIFVDIMGKDGTMNQADITWVKAKKENNG
jgi:hypothetical protein